MSTRAHPLAHIPPCGVQIQSAVDARSLEELMEGEAHLALSELLGVPGKVRARSCMLLGAAAWRWWLLWLEYMYDAVGCRGGEGMP